MLINDPEEGQPVLGPVIHVLLFERLRSGGHVTDKDVHAWAVHVPEEESLG